MDTLVHAGNSVCYMDVFTIQRLFNMRKDLPGPMNGVSFTRGVVIFKRFPCIRT